MRKKTCIITGGSSGIGHASCRALLAEGYEVFNLSRRAEEIDLTSDSHYHGLRTDIKNVQEIQISFKTIKDQMHQPIDALINCAGIGRDILVDQITEADYLNHFDTNVKGVIFTTQAALPLMTEGSSIITVTSICGIKPFTDWSLYCATKFALEGFTRSIREELRPRKIRVMNIQPGAVDTAIYDYLSAEDRASFMRPEVFAKAITAMLLMPTDACVEEIFINNTAGDL